MNKDKHPDLYLNKVNIKETNQSYYEYKSFLEMINEQKKINDSLFQSLQELSHIYMNESQTHAAKWDEVNRHLQQLCKGNSDRQQFEKQLMNEFVTLHERDKEVKRIIETEKSFKQELISQLQAVRQTNENIYHQLTDHELFKIQQANQISDIRGDQKQLLEQIIKQTMNQEQFTDQLAIQIDVQEQLKHQMTKQTNYQEEVLNRLEKHEALTEKMLRQINYFRPIIYERSSYLAEKIEEGYDLTSAYIYNSLTSSEQPLTLYLAHQQKKHREKKSYE